jgi:hypothetical protein
VRGKDHQRDLTEKWRRMSSKWILSKDNGFAHPKHKSVSSGKEYETFDWKAGQPDYRRNVHLKSSKLFFFLRIINR